MRRGLILLLLAACGCGGSHGSSQTATAFHLLVSPSHLTTVNDISDDGTIIVGGDSSEDLPFSWTANGVATRLSDDSPFKASRLTPDGHTIVGTSGNAPGYYQLNVQGAGGLEILPGYDSAVGIAASNDLHLFLAQALISSGAPRPYVLASGSTLPLPDLNSGPSQATALAGQGFVAIGTSNGKPVMWTNLANPTVTALADALGDAYGISDDGTVVVGRETIGGRFVPFRWTEARAVALPLPKNTASAEAVAVSADGSVVVGNAYETATATGIAHPFVWTAAKGTRRIEDLVRFDGAAFAGLTYLRVVTLSADGKQLLGYGQLSASTGVDQRGFVLTLP